MLFEKKKNVLDAHVIENNRWIIIATSPSICQHIYFLRVQGCGAVEAFLKLFLKKNILK
jgi:hypothetical protein